MNLLPDVNNAIMRKGRLLPLGMGTVGGAVVLPVVTVTGGTVTAFNQAGVDYYQAAFAASGSFTINGNISAPQWAMAAGAGTGGRGTSVNMGGGGGAGGLIQSTAALTAGVYVFTRGTGGALTNTANTGNMGTDSVLTLDTVEIFRAFGGGRGATNAGSFSGGSGGGGRGNNATSTAGGTGTAGQGNAGGAGFADTVGTTYAAGGGGGAGGVGGNASASAPGTPGAGVNLSWIAVPEIVCEGGWGSAVGNNNATPLRKASGSHGTSAIAAQAGGNGFMFLVVRADQATMVAV